MENPQRRTGELMIGAVSNNTYIAAMLGPGVARSSIMDDAPGRVQKSGRFDSSRPAPEAVTDTVEITRSTSEENRQTSAPVESGSRLQVKGVDGSSGAQSLQGARASSGRFGAESLSSDEQREVRKLEQRDREVRRHEQAHKAAAGQYARGGASFEFTTGPNGKRYASGGEVSVDTSPVAGNDRATIAKMQQVRRAALAPAEPSSQDRSVAAKAGATERKARSELAQDRGGEPATVVAGGDSTGIGSGAAGGFKTPTSSVERGEKPSAISVSRQRAGGLLDLLA